MKIGIICLAQSLALSLPLCLSVAGAGTAQEAAKAPSPFATFSAKRVKPPSAGTKKRITVQIAPRANPAVPPVHNAAPPAAAATVAAAVAPVAPAVAAPTYGWFWSTVSPELSATGPGRLAPSLVALAQGPAGQSVPAPRLQLLQEIAARHGTDLLRETVGTRVSPALALAVIAVESSGRVDAVSGAGAQGLMQLMPDTAARFGVENSLDAAQNIRGGVKFLDFLMEKFNGDPILVLAGYNAGENSIGKNNGVPPYPETRDYVPKVLAAFNVAKRLCSTPPELVSDGCVFQIMN
ncbi:lytic transglycosylase domain-containing protein [Tropicibacter naphthalenivorans]|uniref:Soluble lytic murein transglycosylase n=1 Tax=Tropicibacter naphthalenivorans TaxID=441103 RepID=A0A0P1GJR7_9RHOB|nr:lytic transglycosylase domain-containing protein [Tropicibacter naphthalenivorans]CUH75724.1 Soluble lytic murein transglycosylase precursor [Tropicibacter naphthalenivorans]SMC42680.1 Soluble lytic murein transglycosylase [Tropicibacter naphthalenivorans]